MTFPDKSHSNFAPSFVPFPVFSPILEIMPCFSPAIPTSEVPARHRSSKRAGSMQYTGDGVMLGCIPQPSWGKGRGDTQGSHLVVRRTTGTVQGRSGTYKDGATQQVRDCHGQEALQCSERCRGPGGITRPHGVAGGSQGSPGLDSIPWAPVWPAQSSPRRAAAARLPHTGNRSGDLRCVTASCGDTAVTRMEATLQ